MFNRVLNFFNVFQSSYMFYLQPVDSVSSVSTGLGTTFFFLLTTSAYDSIIWKQFQNDMKQHTVETAQPSLTLTLTEPKMTFSPIFYSYIVFPPPSLCGPLLPPSLSAAPLNNSPSSEWHETSHCWNGTTVTNRDLYCSKVPFSGHGGRCNLDGCKKTHITSTIRSV